MSGKGNDKANDVVLFEELEPSTGESTKQEQLLSLLSEKLTPEDLGSVRKLLGLPTELSNAELFEKIKAELMKKKPEEEEDPEKKKAAAPSYQEFIKSCMEEGKDLKTCAAEYKEKHGDATDAEIADVEKLAKDEDWGKKKKPEDEEDEYPPAVKKKLEELDAEIKSLKELRRTEGIDAKVDAMVSEDHMTPVQATGIKKLMHGLPDADQNAILDIFRTQKISAREDIGGQVQPGTEPITAERKARLMEEHGLTRLIEEKGGRLPGVE
uniref:Uncharacterized protein n=1 Tax=viral metagenome TaxID=1070528 RepID=A0A6M3M9Y5_9ZZZZ